MLPDALTAIGDNLADEVIFAAPPLSHLWLGVPRVGHVDSASAGYTKTFDVLTRYACYDLEILVDMQYGKAVHFGDRGDEQVRHRGSAMMTCLRQSPLHLNRPPLGSGCDTRQRHERHRRPLNPVSPIRTALCRVSDLEDRRRRNLYQATLDPPGPQLRVRARAQPRER